MIQLLACLLTLLLRHRHVGRHRGRAVELKRQTETGGGRVRVSALPRLLQFLLEALETLV